MIMARLLHFFGIALFVLLGGASALAHESMPASLILREVASNRFDVVWRVPQTQGAAPEIRPVFPEECVDLTAPVERFAPDSKLVEWRIRCNKGLDANAAITFDGLPVTLVDVLVRVSRLDGAAEALVARPRSPSVQLGVSRPQGLHLPAYFGLGVEHILSGTDHLLFVLCLVLLVPSLAGLLKTITAFTLAHSLTLVLSALGMVRFAQAPVEATIALSILFLARELARKGVADGVALRRPWIVAFLFGLLHGFGFAGALAEVGLPQEAIASALLLFNLGVEAGQLLFVLATYPLLLWLRRHHGVWPTWSGFLPVYSIGAVAAFWWLQRMAPVLAPVARYAALI